VSCHRRKAGRKGCWVGTMSLATSYDITRHHAIGSGSGSGAGGIRCHSTEGVAEERRGGGSGSGGQTGVGSGSGRQAGVGSVRGSPYSIHHDGVGGCGSWLCGACHSSLFIPQRNLIELTDHLEHIPVCHRSSSESQCS